VENIIFIVFRRMRAPLLALIGAYSVAVLGLVLIPGQDAAGNTWHMDFFHAFYFVSFTATTIGFGEIPYELTDGQRLWVVFTLYLSVVVWVYSIGTLVALFQDPAFKLAVTERRFARRIRRMALRFYLICGYGETGSALVQALTDRDQSAVVVEIRPERVSHLRLQNLRQYVPALCGDAGRPLHLLEAGLKHPRCAGVAALTNFNEVNLKIAITSKLLHGDMPVICRADSHDVEANMASFGTDFIIDPFDTFASHLGIAFQTPGLHLLHEWLTGLPGQDLPEPVHPPRDGPWVVCGYGRFGKAVHAQLTALGVETRVVEARPENTGMPEGGCVVGRGTEAETLREAGLERAVALVAGTDDDANNLSIIMTALELNPELFVVLRQNLKDNQPIIDAVKADMVMHPPTIIADKIRVLLATPLLHELEQLAAYQPNAWACELLSRITGLVATRVPAVWEVTLDSRGAYAVADALAHGARVMLSHLLADPLERTKPLAAVALLLVRPGERVLVPDEDTALRPGDRLLFCGRHHVRDRMGWTLQNCSSLSYILTGEHRPQGYVWRWLFPRRRSQAGP
jgi:voltage-gated potassium channel